MALGRTLDHPDPGSLADREVPAEVLVPDEVDGTHAVFTVDREPGSGLKHAIMKDDDFSHPPWSPQQVINLNCFQHAGKFHPFTCPRDGTVLVATPNGWVCPAADRSWECSYTQDWAHKFMSEVTEQPGDGEL